jgi:hypothetical protein
MAYEGAVVDMPDLDCIHKSLNTPIDSDDVDYILQKVREDYLAGSTVTIHLIGSYGAENRGWPEQRLIKRELQASLYDGAGNTKNGILGVVLPDAHAAVYRDSRTCDRCGTRRTVVIDDTTTVREFAYNYYLPGPAGCAWSDDDRYCVLATWDKVCADPTGLVEWAFGKRTAPIAAKTRVWPPHRRRPRRLIRTPIPTRRYRRDIGTGRPAIA